MNSTILMKTIRVLLMIKQLSENWRDFISISVKKYGSFIFVVKNNMNKHGKTYNNFSIFSKRKATKKN